jgi:nucleotide-binding universal stress UspA family protein
MAADVFRKIVAPTDFSDCAEAAWALAQRLARTLGSEVVLTHVFVAPPVYGDPPAVSAAWTVVEDTERWVAQEIERWADRARKQGVAVRTVVRHGSPATEIVDVASVESADVIVMGTHGRGGVARALVGSVADRVIRTAPCPTLTVRHPDSA